MDVAGVGLTSDAIHHLSTPVQSSKPLEVQVGHFF